MTTTQNRIVELLEKFPFLTVISYCGSEYVGIVQNTDATTISFYDFQIIPTDDLKVYFLKLGEQWWWESNRMLPINIFIKGEMAHYKIYLKTFSLKETQIMAGPVVSLNDFFKKRIKRRNIQLVRRVGAKPIIT
jgi:hypothetical protein